ncbi:hypothetical protein C0J52_14869 [Blattella germanica]|nr:hypothetical protein C0J52_14869 [Blattella germanica]
MRTNVQRKTKPCSEINVFQYTFRRGIVHMDRCTACTCILGLEYLRAADFVVETVY